MRTLLLMWIFATWAIPACGQDDPVTWTGPWLIQRSDGIRQIGLACSQAQAAFDAVLMPATTTQHLTIHATWHVVPHPARDIVSVLDIRITERECPPGTYHLVVGPRHFDLVIPDGPDEDHPARVAVVGMLNYPSRADMDSLATALHGPIQLAVCLGAGLDEVIGSGGWESSIPLLLLGASSPVDSPLHPHLFPDLVADAAGQWPLGAHWGLLGLPCADVDQAGHAIAADLSPWQVFVEPHASWNPSLHARNDPNPLQAVPLLSLCQHMHVPVVLTGDDGAGFVSEPLLIDHGQMHISPGGTRCLGATPSGEGLSGLPLEIALAVDQPALVGIIADKQTLEIVLCAEGGSELMRLAYTHADDPDTHLGPGWGAGDGEALKKQWLAGDAQSAQGLETLSWLSGPLLAAMRVGEQEMDTLINASAKDRNAMRLLRRLTAVSAIAIGSLQRRAESLPPPVVRDLILRRLGQAQDIDSDLMPVAAASSDSIILRAVLRAYERHPDEDLSRVLIRRIALQAAGSLPLDSDPFIEHRLLTAVFDSTTTSPTPLRPMATALRPRLDLLDRGPVERFIARHGETRAP